MNKSCVCGQNNINDIVIIYKSMHGMHSAHLNTHNSFKLTK